MQITVRKLLFDAQYSLMLFLLYALIGKTLLTLIRAILMGICAALLYRYLRESFGLGNGIAVLVAFCVVYVGTWVALMGRILLFFPFPLCRKGKCQSIDDYSWFHGTFFGKCSWGLYWYSCHCGDQYLRRGKRFMEFIPEVTDPPTPWVDIRKGKTRPYKRLVGFRQWSDDGEMASDQAGK